MLCGALCCQQGLEGGDRGHYASKYVERRDSVECGALCWQQGGGTGQATCWLDRANTHTTREQADVEGALSPALSILKFLKSSMEI